MPDTENVQGIDVVNKNLAIASQAMLADVKTAVEITLVEAQAHATAGHPKWQGGPSPGPRFMSRTGNLVQSIRAEDVQVIPGVEVVGWLRAGNLGGAKLIYAKFVEEGTRFMRSYPYMMPALLAVQAKFKRRVKIALGGK